MINKLLVPFLLIPVFFAYGPNYVGYETIIETNLNDGAAIQDGDKIACNFLTEYGDHRLVEGTFLRANPPMLLVDTPLFKNIPLPIEENFNSSAISAEFCLTYNQHKSSK